MDRSIYGVERRDEKEDYGGVKAPHHTGGTDPMSDYEARQEARRERLHAAADKAEARAHSYYRKSDLREEVSGIPLGQPILVGHHSERRHRRAIERADQAMRKCVEESKRAKELRARANGVGHAGISSEDPEAVDKIAAKVAKLEADQARMKAVNAAIRRHKKAGPDAQVAALVELGFGEGVARKLLEPDFCGRIGFPDYALQNNNANIRRLKARIPKIEAVKDAEEVTEQVGGIEYREAEGRVWLVFPGKPAADVRAKLRRAAFKWSPTRGAWVRMLTEAARYQARQLLAEGAQ